MHLNKVGHAAVCAGLCVACTLGISGSPLMPNVAQADSFIGGGPSASEPTTSEFNSKLYVGKGVFDTSNSELWGERDQVEDIQFFTTVDEAKAGLESLEVDKKAVVPVATTIYAADSSFTPREGIEPNRFYAYFLVKKVDASHFQLQLASRLNKTGTVESPFYPMYNGDTRSHTFWRDSTGAIAYHGQDTGGKSRVVIKNFAITFTGGSVNLSRIWTGTVTADDLFNGATLKAFFYSEEAEDASSFVLKTHEATFATSEKDKLLELLNTNVQEAKTDDGSDASYMPYAEYAAASNEAKAGHYSYYVTDAQGEMVDVSSDSTLAEGSYTAHFVYMKKAYDNPISAFAFEDTQDVALTVVGATPAPEPQPEPVPAPTPQPAPAPAPVPQPPAAAEVQPMPAKNAAPVKKAQLPQTSDVALPAAALSATGLVSGVLALALRRFKRKK